MAARALPILMYHHVSPSPGLVTVSPQTFRAQMQCLAAQGYRSVGGAEVAAFLQGEPLPDKCVAISFDDGYLDNWLHAHPVLAECGLKAMLFLITGWLGDGPARSGGATPDHNACAELIKAGRADEAMLRWSEVQAMQAAGTFEFHSHTHSHTRWDRTVSDPIERAQRLAEDLGQSRTALQARLGVDSRHLCWPQGHFDADYQRVAQAAGFDYLYTVEKGTCTPATAAAAIPRVVVKDRAGGWFSRRLWLYRQPALTAAYLRLRGD